MNVLGLFLADRLRRSVTGPVPLRGTIEIAAGTMRAAVVFGEEGVRVSRDAGPPTVRIEAPMARLVRALVRPGLSWLRLRVRGNRWFALRALRYLRP